MLSSSHADPGTSTCSAVAAASTNHKLTTLAAHIHVPTHNRQPHQVHPHVTIPILPARPMHTSRVDVTSHYTPALRPQTGQRGATATTRVMTTSLCTARQDFMATQCRAHRTVTHHPSLGFHHLMQFSGSSIGPGLIRKWLVSGLFAKRVTGR